jgi:hypothetical protein
VEVFVVFNWKSFGAKSYMSISRFVDFISYLVHRCICIPSHPSSEGGQKVGKEIWLMRGRRRVRKVISADEALVEGMSQ